MRVTIRQLRKIIREELSVHMDQRSIDEMRVSAGSDYMNRYENPMAAVQKMLRDYLSELPRSDVTAMAPGAPEVMQEVDRALDELGINDPKKRDLISRPLRMVPPSAFLAPAPV